MVNQCRISKEKPEIYGGSQDGNGCLLPQTNPWWNSFVLEGLQTATDPGVILPIKDVLCQKQIF